MACECGCGGTPSLGKRYIAHHQWRKKTIIPVVDPDIPRLPPSMAEVSVPVGSPPPHPLPFDHGKYRIAEEPIGTNPFQPWQLFYCVECREPAWRKNLKADLCESCSYMLVEALTEDRVKKENRTLRGTYDPFR